MDKITIHLINGENWDVKEEEIIEFDEHKILLQHSGEDEIFVVPMKSIAAIVYSNRQIYDKIHAKFPRQLQ